MHTCLQKAQSDRTARLVNSTTAGKRMDNRARERPGHPGQPGVRFFVEDEDEFALEDLLQVLPATL